VRQHVRAVDEVEDVELEHVAPELDRQPQRRQRVLWSERARTAVTNLCVLARRAP
jgi:hypothetical protein